MNLNNERKKLTKIKVPQRKRISTTISHPQTVYNNAVRQNAENQKMLNNALKKLNAKAKAKPKRKTKAKQKQESFLSTLVKIISKY